MKAAVSNRSIGLLTPYSGCNLGDGAIQEAIKQAILDRFPSARIVMLTADPENTTYIHKCPSFPMTGLHIPGYSATIRRSNRGPALPAEGETQSLRSRVRGNRVTNLLVGLPYRGARAVVRPMWQLLNEVRHTVRAYRLAKELDMIIVSGGGQIDDYFGGAMAHPYTLAKWGRIAAWAGCEYVMLSVGVGDVKGALSRLFVDHALRAASYRSFRDAGSRELVSFSRAAGNDPVVPDLAFSYPLPGPRAVVGPRSRRLKVGVAPIAYLSSYGWPEEDPQLFGRYLDGLARFCLRLNAEHELVLFYTDVPDDQVAEKLIDRLKPGDAGRPPVRMERYSEPHELVEGLGGLDVVVASRLHAVILSHLVGVPALAISYERKVAAHMRDVGQESSCLEIDTVTPDQLTAAFTHIVADYDRIVKVLERAVSKKRSVLNGQYREVLEGAAALGDGSRAPALEGAGS